MALFTTLEQHQFILHRIDIEYLDVADANGGGQNISIFFMLWCTFVPSLGIKVSFLSPCFDSLKIIIYYWKNSVSQPQYYKKYYTHTPK